MATHTRPTHTRTTHVTGADLAQLAAMLEMAAVALATWARDFDRIEHPSPAGEQRCAEAMGTLLAATHAVNVWVTSLNSIDPRSIS